MAMMPITTRSSRRVKAFRILMRHLRGKAAGGEARPPPVANQCYPVKNAWRLGLCFLIVIWSRVKAFWAKPADPPDTSGPAAKTDAAATRAGAGAPGGEFPPPLPRNTVLRGSSRATAIEPVALF